MSQGVVISQPGEKKGQGQEYQTQYGMDNQAMNMEPVQAGYGHQPPPPFQAGYGHQPPPPIQVGYDHQPPPAYAPAVVPGALLMIPNGLPASMGYLASLDEIKVEQILELAEVLVGWERNNKYNICNNMQQKFMYAKEDTDCCMRQMCGPFRPFTMNITDNTETPVMRLVRPYRCQASWLWCCYLQEMEIESPPGQLQGTVKQIWTCCSPKYKVYDSQNQVIFSIVGDCCYCKCCADVMFTVLEGDVDSGGQEIGQIIKHWGGCREVFGGANNFSVKFPQNMDLMKKILLFGATFLIDFNYFEKNNG